MLQARWAMVKGLAHSWYRNHIANVMYGCIIMHNMIINDEGQRVSDWSDDEAGTSAGRATLLVIRGLPYGINEKMRNQQAHHALMSDIISVVTCF